MKKYTLLADLLLVVEKTEDEQWVYVDRNKWKRSPESCSFWLIPESEVDNMPDDEVYESDAGPFLPLALKDENLYPWLTMDTLRGIMYNLRLKGSISSNIPLIIKGINYYLEYDDFMEVV